MADRPTKPHASLPRDALLRVAAAGVLLFGVALCHRMALVGHGVPGRAAMFVTLLTVAGGIAFFAQGLGGALGAGLGAVAGLSAAIALTTASQAPPQIETAFTIVCGVITTGLGYFAGSRSVGAAGGAVSMTPVRDERSHAAEVCGAIAADFCQWVRGFVDSERSIGDAAASANSAAATPAEGPSWADFDQFVRHTLRQRLGAGGVRVFNLSEDGELLHPLSCRRSAARRRDGAALSARAGLVGRVLSGGEPFVAGDPQRDGVCDELARELVRAAEAESRPGPATSPGWTWLLPLRHHGRPRAVIAVARLDAASVLATSPVGGALLVSEVRDLLETQWAYVNETQGLQAVARTDRQSGVLGRTDLLTQLRRDADDSAGAGEPLMVLAVALEGLRRLDDQGAWARRDALIEQFAAVMRERVRSDDSVGRFSDDRFVVVLRRLDHGLGRRIAAKLVETVRAVLATTAAAGAGSDSGGSITVRAGLCGTGAERTSGDQLLERALKLLDVARQQNIELAVELTPTRAAECGATAGR